MRVLLNGKQFQTKTEAVDFLSENYNTTRKIVLERWNDLKNVNGHIIASESDFCVTKTNKKTFYYRGNIYKTAKEVYDIANVPKNKRYGRIYEKELMKSCEIINMEDIIESHKSHTNYEFEEFVKDCEKWYKTHDSDPSINSESLFERRLCYKIGSVRKGYNNFLNPNYAVGTSKLNEAEITALNQIGFHWNGNPVRNSMVQQSLLFYMLKAFPTTEHRNRTVLKRSENLAGQVVDIYVPEVNLVVEFHDTYHHTSPRNQHWDVCKTVNLAKRGIDFIRIVGKNVPSISNEIYEYQENVSKHFDEINTDFDTFSPETLEATLKNVFKVICLKYNRKCPDIKIIRDWRNIENLISDVKKK